MVSGDVCAHRAMGQSSTSTFSGSTCRDDRCADAVGRGVKPEDIDGITCKSCEELATSLIKGPSCQGVVACSHCKKKNFSRNYSAAHKCQICARKVCDVRWL